MSRWLRALSLWSLVRTQPARNDESTADDDGAHNSESKQLIKVPSKIFLLLHAIVKRRQIKLLQIFHHRAAPPPSATNKSVFERAWSRVNCVGSCIRQRGVGIVCCRLNWAVELIKTQQRGVGWKSSDCQSKKKKNTTQTTSQRRMKSQSQSVSPFILVSRTHKIPRTNFRVFSADPFLMSF